MVEARIYPFVEFSQIFVCNRDKCASLQVAQNITACIPHFVAEAAAHLEAVLVDEDVLSLRAHVAQGELERVCSVHIDYFERVDSVAERLRHLASLLVAYESVDVDVVERCLSGEFKSCHNHTAHPEEHAVVPGYERRRRIEFLEVVGVLRPAQCAERPEP